MDRLVNNTHERLIPARPEQVWDRLVHLGSSADPIYPGAWGWIRFPEGIRPGALVIHNAAAQVSRYAIAAVDPPWRLWFGDVPGMAGGHGFQLDAVAGGTRVRHIMTARMSPAIRVLWWLVGHYVHDATSEELLDNLKRAVTGRLDRPYRRPVPARLLRAALRRRIATPVPDLVS